MPVIQYKKTDLADPDTPWDGDAERAKAQIDDLKIMCAWYQEPGEAKDNYKLPHHRASDHACVLNGVRSALRLLAATHMPDDDRPAVRAHLEKHLQDFGLETEQAMASAAQQTNQAQAVLQGEIAGRAGGRRYEVIAITAGNGNGLFYPEATLQAACHLFEGASVFVDHAQLGEIYSFTGSRSLRSLLGILEGVYYSAQLKGICGVLRVYPGADAEWFCQMVDQHLKDKAAGKPTPCLGLSAVVDIKTNGGKEVIAIEKVISVDAVFDPARGGQFIRALNQNQRKEVIDMTEQSAEEQNVMASAAQQSQPAESLLAALSENILELRLGASQLPGAMKALIRQQFTGRPFELKDLDNAIEKVQSAWAQSVAENQPQVHGLGQPRWEVGFSETERLQAVMDKLCGLKPPSEALQGIRPVSGIRELYLMLTGDYDFRGTFDPERVALANVTCSTMTSLVKNAFNKVIMDYFNTVDRWWEPIVAEENFESMKDVTLVTLGGFADLPTVTEGGDYTELSWSDEEEVVPFVKKGAYVGVTLEMMDKDETRTFRAIPRKLAIAGYRALSGAIANLWLANSGVGPYWPSSQSTYRLFDTHYGNLGSSALSASAWDAVIQAMYKQTEATSSERMGIRPSYLVVPIELEKTALTIMQSEGEPGTADNDANVRRGSARVIVCPEMSDANDWLAVADPRIWPGIVVGYRFSNVPEVFIADQETVGSMFTNDEMRIKARFIFAVGACDYRPLYKSNVT